MEQPTQAEAQLFTKRPVTISAVHFTEALRDSIVLDGVPFPEGVQCGAKNWNQKSRKVYSAHFYIDTLEGRMTVDLGDWIIKGVKGEFYPCKPDIFEATYSKAESLRASQQAERAVAAEPTVNRETVIEWLDANDIEVTDRQIAGLFHAAPVQQAAPAGDALQLERDRICAAIKAEDDYCVDHGDYMLDSDDCIKIVRGDWVRPDFAAAIASQQP